MIISWFDLGGIAYRNCIVRHVLDNYGIGTDDTIFPDGDFTYNLGPCSYHSIVSDLSGATYATTVPNSYLMVYGTISTKMYRGMKNDTTKMVDSQAFSDPTTGWDRDSSRDLNKFFDEKTERLNRNVVLPTPVEKTKN